MRSAAAIFAFWLLMLGLMTAVWSTPLATGQLAESDDYMRMVRVFDLMDDRALETHQQPRLGYGGIAELGWSRLIDAPTLFVQTIAEEYKDRYDAAMLTATILPALLLLALIRVCFWQARAFLPSGKSLVALLALFLMWAMLRQFMPGRVDHHMWQLVLFGTALGSIYRIYIEPEKMVWPILTALCFATGMAIGAEIIPWLALCTALLGFFWLIHGRRYEGPSLLMGSVLLAAVSFYHVALFPSGEFLTPACDRLSIVWVAIAACIPAFWVTVLLIPAVAKNSLKRRFNIGCLVTLPIVMVLFAFYPDCMLDPYGIDDPVVRKVWLNGVLEAKSLPALMNQSMATALFFALPLFLGFAASFAVWRKAEDRKDFWAGMTIFMGCAVALACYQVRTVDFAQVAAILPLTYGMVMVAERGTASRKTLRFIAAGIFVLAGVMALYAVTGKDKQTEENTGIVTAHHCNPEPVMKMMAGWVDPAMIAAPTDLGAEFLFRTKYHAVLAAPYHRNELGIRAVYDIFTAPDFATAKEYLDDSKAGIIVACESQTDYWVGMADGREDIFIVNIFKGQVPDWLEEVSLETFEKGMSAPAQNRYRMFEVKR